MSALFKSFSLAIAAFALIAVTSGPVLAQNATVEERQKVMKSFGATMGMIGKWLKTGEGNPAALEQRLMQMAAAGPNDRKAKLSDVLALSLVAAAIQQRWSKLL